MGQSQRTTTVLLSQRGTQALFSTALAVTPKLAELGAQLCSAWSRWHPIFASHTDRSPSLGRGGPQSVSCRTPAFPALSQQ